MASPRKTNILLFSEGVWRRFPAQGWQFGGDTSTWSIAGKSDESCVGFSWQFHAANHPSPFKPLIHAQKIDDRQHKLKFDTLVLHNFKLEPVMRLLHAKKLISDATLQSFQDHEYRDFVNSVTNEEFVSFAGGTKDGSWLKITEKNRLQVLQVLEDGKLIPQGVTEDYKAFMSVTPYDNDQIAQPKPFTMK